MNPMKPHHPRKRFGQHFLTDASVLHEIMRSIALTPTDRVVEIGPGQGALTQYLLSEISHIDAVELDRDLIVYLREKYDSARLTVHAADALDFDYSTLSNTSSDLRIVGNLPYNISTPLLFKLFSEIDSIQDMHFMLQNEVVLRLTAETDSADYGRLSVMSQYFCENTYLFIVPPEAFNPPPKVESAIVRLTPRKNYPLNKKQFDLFSTLVKEAFTYRRKKLSNGLQRFISPAQLTALQISADARPQEITVSDFIRITQAISVE